jgi:hypothetical protein
MHTVLVCVGKTDEKRKAKKTKNEKRKMKSEKRKTKNEIPLSFNLKPLSSQPLLYYYYYFFVDLQAQNQGNKTPFAVALECGSIYSVVTLLEATPQVNYPHFPFLLL